MLMLQVCVCVCVCVCVWRDACDGEVWLRAGNRGVAEGGVPPRLLVTARHPRSPGSSLRHQRRQTAALLRLQRSLVDAVSTVLVNERTVLQGQHSARVQTLATTPASYSSICWVTSVYMGLFVQLAGNPFTVQHAHCAVYQCPVGIFLVQMLN